MTFRKKNQAMLLNDDINVLVFLSLESINLNKVAFVGASLIYIYIDSVDVFPEVKCAIKNVMQCKRIEENRNPMTLILN